MSWFEDYLRNVKVLKQVSERDIKETLEDRVLRLERELKEIKKSLKELTSGLRTII